MAAEVMVGEVRAAAAERADADNSAAKIPAALPAVMELNVTGTILCINAFLDFSGSIASFTGIFTSGKIVDLFYIVEKPRLRLAFGLLAIYLECQTPDQEDMSLNPHVHKEKI